MKTNKLFFLFCILLSMLATNASAYDFAVKNADGVMIYYNYINNKTEACVTNKEKYKYSGSIAIPKEITYEGRTLKVTEIGNSAFYYCSSLESVTIPNSVTSIGNNAFTHSNLTSVTIPNGVTSIGGYAFEGCIYLESITIPNSVTSIGESAFRECSSLQSVTIPNSVTSIESYAFLGCSGLTSITVEEGNTYYDSRDNSNAIIETKSNTLIHGCKNTIIPNSVTSIGDYAFENCRSLKTITIPNSVTSIGGRAFYYCYSLQSITIPNSVTSIGGAAFKGCDNLKTITIPNSVTSIGNSAFGGCSSLKTITIPNSVTSIGDFTFDSCSSLESVTIPNSVTSIGNHAFAYCDKLVSVTIPNSVTSIGEWAFQGCDNLEKVTSKIAKPFAIYTDAFSYETYFEGTLYVPKGTVAQYEATNGWTNFRNIVEEDSTTAINDVEADNTLNTANAIYDINGKRLPVTSLDELPSGLYIINGKKVVK